jgi:hypothetical protein
MSKQTLQLVAAAHNNDTVTVTAVDWPFGVKLDNCLGFSLTRTNKAGMSEVIETHMPFDGEDNKDWKTKPSSQWPIQRKYWIDFTGKPGETYTYTWQALGGTPGNLTPIAGLSATTNPITLTTKVDDTFHVAFTRGILSTQWLARMIGIGPDGQPDFQKIIAALEDYKNPNNVIRKTLVANVPALLKAAVTEAEQDGGHVYMALYELSANELVDWLLEKLQYFSVILGNTGKDDFTNASSRKALHDAGADIHDRFIGEWGIPHNKSQVKVTKDGKPTDVTTGSTNWTNTGMGCQSNMVVRIFNAQVGENFLDYWNRLLADNSQQSLEFRRRNAQGYAPITLSDGTIIETYFQPSMDEKTKPKNAADVKLSPFLARVKGFVEGAQQVLCGEVFYPGNPSVVQWFAEQWDKKPSLYAFMTVSTPDALRGVKAKRRKGRPPLFTIATGREKDFADFVKELLKLPEAHAITHGKIIVIDPWGPVPVVIFGSDNLGAKASYGNDENGVIVIGNKRLAQFVFVNMFDINKHFAGRSAARASDYSKKQSGWTGKLSTSDSWQTGWLDGYRALEARLLATGVWDGSSLKDSPYNRSVLVIPFPKKTDKVAAPADGGGDTKVDSAANNPVEQPGPAPDTTDKQPVAAGSTEEKK